MNEFQAENLRILIRHMETKVMRTLNMSAYFIRGTPACALGEACTIPELLNRGLSVEVSTVVIAVGPQGDFSVFGLSAVDHDCLFGTAKSNYWGECFVPPEVWAARAREVLASYGYSMQSVQGAAFESFMVKVLHPVPCTKATDRRQEAST